MGSRFWQNVDEEATKRKEKEEERKKKKKKPALQTRAKITELPDDADPDFAFDSKGNKKAVAETEDSEGTKNGVVNPRGFEHEFRESRRAVFARCRWIVPEINQRRISIESVGAEKSEIVDRRRSKEGVFVHREHGNVGGFTSEF